MSFLVDFHTHLFSWPFFVALADASPAPGTPEEKIRRAAAQAGIDVPPADTAQHVGHWVRELDRYGVQHAVTFASVPEEAETVLEAVELAGGRLSGMAVVDPTRPGTPDRVADWLARGLRGVVLFPALHRYRIDAPEAAATLAVVDRNEAVAVVHCGLLSIPIRERFGLPAICDPALADPLHVIPAALSFPRATFVVPHFGAGFLRETFLLGRQCRNACVDTSSSNSWIAAQPVRTSLVDVLEGAIRVFGAERVLFGTDSSAFPRGWRHDVLTAQREALGAIGMSELDRRRILGGNAARLLGLAA